MSGPALAPSSSEAPHVSKPATHSTSYAQGTYWDGRYAERETSFDWFFTYGALRELICDSLSHTKALPCLHVGCGNSTIQLGMVKDGFSSCNVDISEVVIEQMRRAHCTVPELAYDVADCRSMPQYGSDSFGSVLDKGTLDAVLCCNSGQADTRLYIQEVYRLLAPGGTFLLISLGTPEVRLALLGQPQLEWDVQLLLLPKPAIYMKALQQSAPANAPPPSSSHEGITKDQSVRPLGPFPAASALQDTAAQGLCLTEYFTAYVCTKTGSTDGWAGSDAARAAAASHAPAATAPVAVVPLDSDVPATAAVPEGLAPNQRVLAPAEAPPAASALEPAQASSTEVAGGPSGSLATQLTAVQPALDAAPTKPASAGSGAAPASAVPGSGVAAAAAATPAAAAATSSCQPAVPVAAAAAVRVLAAGTMALPGQASSAVAGPAGKDGAAGGSICSSQPASASHPAQQQQEQQQHVAASGPEVVPQAPGESAAAEPTAAAPTAMPMAAALGSPGMPPVAVRPPHAGTTAAAAAAVTAVAAIGSPGTTPGSNQSQAHSSGTDGLLWFSPLSSPWPPASSSSESPCSPHSPGASILPAMAPHTASPAALPVAVPLAGAAAADHSSALAVSNSSGTNSAAHTSATGASALRGPPLQPGQPLSSPPLLPAALPAPPAAVLQQLSATAPAPPAELAPASTDSAATQQDRPPPSTSSAAATTGPPSGGLPAWLDADGHLLLLRGPGSGPVSRRPSSEQGVMSSEEAAARLLQLQAQQQTLLHNQHQVDLILEEAHGMGTIDVLSDACAYLYGSQRNSSSCWAVEHGFGSDSEVSEWTGPRMMLPASHLHMPGQQVQPLGCAGQGLHGIRSAAAVAAADATLSPEQAALEAARQHKLAALVAELGSDSTTTGGHGKPLPPTSSDGPAPDHVALCQAWGIPSDYDPMLCNSELMSGTLMDELCEASVEGSEADRLSISDHASLLRRASSGGTSCGGSGSGGEPCRTRRQLSGSLCAAGRLVEGSWEDVAGALAGGRVAAGAGSIGDEVARDVRSRRGSSGSAGQRGPGQLCCGSTLLPSESFAELQLVSPRQ